MNCDELFTENSCRFCLGPAENHGSSLSDIHLLVERRLEKLSTILNFLGLKVYQKHNLPNKMCNDCKKCITSFYALKRTFSQNEAVLTGIDTIPQPENLTENHAENKIRTTLRSFLDKFVDDNPNEQFKISRFSDQLVVDINSDVTAQEIVVITNHFPSNRLSTNSESEKIADDSSTVNPRESVNDEESKSAVEVQNKTCENFEEHLDEDMLDQQEINPDYDEPIYEPESMIECDEFYDSEQIKVEPNISEEAMEEGKQFVCNFCPQVFNSRSGRDTHQQLKHKLPDDFSAADIDSHVLEEELDTGELILKWMCPKQDCNHISRKKNHHLTHLKRHAIREAPFDIVKQEAPDDATLVITQTQSLRKSAPSELVVIESSPEQAQKCESENPLILPVSASKKTIERVVNCSVIKRSDHYACSECNGKFITEDSANNHVSKYGITSFCKNYVCQECSTVFSSEKSFIRHQNSHTLSHIIEYLQCFDCEECCVSFGNPDDLKKHQALHSEGYQYNPETTTTIDSCEIIIRNLDEYVWNGVDLHCAYCVKTGTKSEMILHQSLYHANLICPFDNQDFSRGLIYYLDHMKTKHPEAFGKVNLIFTCPHCNMEFPSKTEVREHCKICSAKSFSCTHCDKKYALERQLKQHMALVNGIKKYKCDKDGCHKEFSNRTELNVHTRCHTKAKPYSCTFPNCGKSFRTNSHRSAHMDTHNLDKNFKCQFCDQMFLTRGNRRLHERTHREPRSVCPLCNKEFRQRSHFIRHVNFVHRITGNSSNIEENINASRHIPSNDANQSDDSR